MSESGSRQSGSKPGADPGQSARGRPLLQPNAQHQYQVTRDDLPLSCPMPEMYLWNSHPRVYLPIEQSGWAKCAYCGAEYHLVGAGSTEVLPDVQMS